MKLAHPTKPKLGALIRLGVRADVAFDDQPDELRWADRIRTVTVDSAFDFVSKRDPGAVRIILGGDQ